MYQITSGWEDDFTSDKSIADPDVKAAEARCRKMIEELGTQGGSSFHLTFVCKLSRWVAADSATKTMQEYRFELRYN